MIGASRRATGRDPFNQNFRKFWSKTQWIGSVQPEKFRKNWSTFWGGPLFPVGPVRILVEWIAPTDTVVFNHNLRPYCFLLDQYHGCCFIVHLYGYDVTLKRCVVGKLYFQRSLLTLQQQVAGANNQVAVVGDVNSECPSITSTLLQWEFLWSYALQFNWVRTGVKSWRHHLKRQMRLFHSVDLKGAMSRPAHVQDFYLLCWFSQLSAILDLGNQADLWQQTSVYSTVLSDFFVRILEYFLRPVLS